MRLSDEQSTNPPGLCLVWIVDYACRFLSTWIIRVDFGFSCVWSLTSASWLLWSVDCGLYVQAKIVESSPWGYSLEFVILDCGLDFDLLCRSVCDFVGALWIMDYAGFVILLEI